jgi:hypothetical protein
MAEADAAHLFNDSVERLGREHGRVGPHGPIALRFERSPVRSSSRQDLDRRRRNEEELVDPNEHGAVTGRFVPPCRTLVRDPDSVHEQPNQAVDVGGVLE